MKQVIIHQNGDGVAVIHPAPGLSAQDCVKDVPEGVAYQIVDAATLPSDRYFRRAWKVGNGSVDVDIEGAKEVQRDHWRKLREPKLAALDIEFMKAVEDASPARRSAIKAQKDALRDVTETPLPDDLEAIRNTIPDILL